MATHPEIQFSETVKNLEPSEGRERVEAQELWLGAYLCACATALQTLSPLVILTTLQGWARDPSHLRKGNLIGQEE